MPCDRASPSSHDSVGGGMHGGGHQGLGGDMLNLLTSPSDPLFYLRMALSFILLWMVQAEHCFHVA